MNADPQEIRDPVLPTPTAIARNVREVISGVPSDDDPWAGISRASKMIRDSRAALPPGLRLDPTRRDPDAEILLARHELLAAYGLADVPALPLLDLSIPEPPVTWILPEWIEKGSIVGLSGRPKIGKSTVLADMARGISSGKPCCLGSPAEPLRVLWIDRDQGPSRCKRLFQRVGAVGIPELMVCSGTSLSLRDSADVRQLEATIIEQSIGVTFLDSWSTLNPGADERSETEQTLLIANLRRLADSHGVTFVVILHDRKRHRDSTDDPVENVRGSSAIAACLDTIISARPVNGGTALDLAVEAGRADERPRQRIEYAREGDRVTLTPTGSPVAAETRQALVETFITSQFPDPRILERADIVETCEAAGHKAKVADKALAHLVETGALWRPRRGLYQLARYSAESAFSLE